MTEEASRSVRQCSFLGNYLPRKCGIATFTTDLRAAISCEFPHLGCGVIAMNDPGARYAYDPEVRFEIADGDVASYRRAADFLNVGTTDVLSVQHEYGIFGGRAGSHLLVLLRELRMPIVTTLHTIVGNPTADQRRVMDDLTRLTTRFVVMSKHGADLLHDVHAVPRTKIDVIPHGIPAIPATPASKSQLGLGGKSVIMTFGLLSPDKGLEYVVEAMPRIVARHPNAVYMVVGATHPHVKQRSGEAYRRTLALLAQRLGVAANIVFHDRFMSLPELVDFLAVSDVYVTPYLNPEQIASGTLAYAVGAGKAVVSTPYRYARELLADGRGLLVPSRDSAAVADAIVSLLTHPDERTALGARAAHYGRDMVWSKVARRYVATMERAHAEHAKERRSTFKAKTLASRPTEFLDVNLQHLRRMTDSTGVLQHAAFSIPRYEHGYCVDDNARALLLMAMLEDAGIGDPEETRALASSYLAFVSHSFNDRRKRFRNFMAYCRKWTEEQGSEDSHGRALWALGAVIGRSRDPGRQSLSGHLFQSALPTVSTFGSPRAWAFTLLGIHEYLRAFQGDSGVEAMCHELSHRLLSLFQRNGTPDWPWCEDTVTYDNARLPEALIASGSRMGDAEMTGVGLRALTWLVRAQQTPDGYFSPIGSDGFYHRTEAKAGFDQQPLEACAMVSACLVALGVTGERCWASEMRRSFRWFLGDNQLHVSLYDPVTGGCRDGLHADRPNENQGAESTLSFLLALVSMGMLDGETRLQAGARSSERPPLNHASP